MALLRDPTSVPSTPKLGRSGLALPTLDCGIRRSATVSVHVPMRRGEICLVDLEPVRGSEADKRRPAIVVSNDGVNSTASRLGRGVVTVVPVTSNTRRIYSFQVLIPAASSGLTRDSKAQAEQVRSVNIGRVGRSVGRLPVDLQEALDEALRLHLRL